MWIRFQASGRRSLRHSVIGMLILGFVLGALWRWTPLQDHLSINWILGWTRSLPGNSHAMPIVIVAYVVGNLFFFMHAFLIWLTAFTFDPVHSVIYCEAGSFASALCMYSLGRLLHADWPERFSTPQTDRLTRALSRHGALTLVVLHIFPICPFSVLNLLSGATQVNFQDFVIGTLAGITPGILIVSFLGSRMVQTIYHPHGVNVVELIAFILLGGVVLWRWRKYMVDDSE